jgi:arylsulfatase A-like enzyme
MGLIRPSRFSAGAWLACAFWFGSVPRTARAQDASQPAPVILISIDTLRADHLSAYGYRKIHTPNIDSFAQQGTLFTDVACQVPLTLPSHTSLLTSTYPFQNGIEENAEPVPSGAATLAGVLRSHGYKTGAFIGSVFLEREFGLDQGFDLYDSPFNFQAGSRISGSMIFAGGSQNPYSVRERRDGALVVRAALQWLAANHGQPVFAFLHLFDVHEPYSVPTDFARERGISRYDAQVEYADQVLGRFRQRLMQSGWWDRSLVILLSDHGESLGEHGESSHGYFIYQSTLWVPLMVHWPAGAPHYPERTNLPAGLIDVAPTILDFLHIPMPSSFEGQSLLGGVQSGASGDAHTVYSESVYTRDAFGWAPLRGVRAGKYKYIAAPKPELYNLQQDPGEQVNLAGKHLEEESALRGRLDKLLARYPAKQTMARQDASPETRAILQSLGYLSGGPKPPPGSAAPDPKDRLPEYHLYERALTSLSDRHMEEAIATFRQILAHNPHNMLARRDLGDCYLEVKDYASARSTLRAVVAEAPDDYMAQLELGMADEHLGLIEEAREHVQAACKMFPGSAQCQHELDAIQRKVKEPAPTATAPRTSR